MKLLKRGYSKHLSYLSAFTLLELLISTSLSLFILLFLVAFQNKYIRKEYNNYLVLQQHNTFLNFASLLRERYRYVSFKPRCPKQPSDYQYNLSDQETELLQKRMYYPINGGQYMRASSKINADLWENANKGDFLNGFSKSSNQKYWPIQSDYLEITFLTKLDSNINQAILSNSSYFSIDRSDDLSPMASHVYFLATDCKKAVIFSTSRKTTIKNVEFYLNLNNRLSINKLDQKSLQIYQIHIDTLSITKGKSNSRPHFKISQYGNPSYQISFNDIEQMQILYHVRESIILPKKWYKLEEINQKNALNSIDGIMIIPLISRANGKTNQEIDPPKLDNKNIGNKIHVVSKSHQFIRPFVIIRFRNSI